MEINNPPTSLILCSVDQLTKTSIRYLWLDRNVSSESNKSNLYIFRAAANVEPFSTFNSFMDKVKTIYSK